MAEITAAMVQELREATNVGMMECKRALVEAGGDKDKAIRLLRERGMAIAAKKASRTANQGLIAAATRGGKVGALVEVNCETDFVAKNEGFQKFVKALAEKSLDLADGTIGEAAKADVTAKVVEIGENIIAKRNVCFSVQGNGSVVTYIHLGGKVGVMLELGCGQAATVEKAPFQDLAKELALHVTACSPRCLTRSEVSAEVITAEREIYAKQVTDKPAHMVEKIVDGKMGKFYAQVCMLEQGFVKDPDTSVTKLLDAKGKELGDTLSIRRFIRYQLGE